MSSGGGRSIGLCSVACLRVNVTCPCFVRSCTDSRLCLRDGARTAVVVMSSGFVAMVIFPVWVMGQRCPVAVRVSLPVVRWSWGGCL